jgi:hypothetical protein
LGVNDCLTHCANVLREGGLEIPTGQRAFIKWLKGRE